MKTLFRKFSAWFSSARQTERISAVILGASVVGAAIYFPAVQLNDYIDAAATKAITRKEDLKQINRLLGQYKELNSRLEQLKETFDASLMTFEEVTVEIDRIIRESIGTDNYTLKKDKNPDQIGFEYEKQDFEITINSATLEQVVKLLHSVEQGNRPLFLGNVSLTRSPQKNEFTAQLKIFSVRKS